MTPVISRTPLGSFLARALPTDVTRMKINMHLKSRMPETIAEQFIQHLSTLEASGDAGPLAALFTADAEVGNVIAPEKFHGAQGAQEFWTHYRDTFARVQSTFRNRIIEENRIALEWNTECTSIEGAPIQYSGVSVLEVTGGKISRFRAYFDPAALGRQMEV